MSNSARERENPPPRRRSCTACIKAKRRCDYSAAPACLRCARRNLSCDYPTHRQNAPPPPLQQRPATTGQRVSSMLATLAEDRALLEEHDPASAAAAADPAPYVDDPVVAPEDLDALLHTSSLDMDMSSLIADVTAAADKGSSFHFSGLDGFDVPVDLDSTALGSFCGLDPLPTPATANYDSGMDAGSSSTPSTDEDNSVPELNFLKTPPAPHGTIIAPAQQQLQYVSSMIRERLEFAVELIRTAPRTMVEALETPWSHHLLYKAEMPPSMQDALSSCALYVAKNPVNTPVVFSLLDARVNTLLVSPPPATLRLALAHTHALILYQVMRLFDGDISARSRGESLIPALEASTMHLLSFVRFDSELLRVTDLAPYPVQPARDLWHDWLLHESARRTVLITFYMLQAYRAMAHPARAEARCLALCHTWTLSRAMWKADSPAAFAQVWREGRWFVVTNKRFQETLREARADDVDEFGRMWITALMGVDESEGWFASKGGSLRERETAPAALVC